MPRLLFCIIVCLCAPVSAWAAPVCMDAFEMEAALIDWYGETPVSGAVTANQQLWASDATGTWTLMELHTDGTACVLGQGDDWRAAGTLLSTIEQSLGPDGSFATPETVAFVDTFASAGG